MGRLPAALAVLLLAGCSMFGGDDEELQPSPLVDFSPTVNVKEIWRVSVGDGAELPMRGLRPAYAEGTVYAAAADGRIKAIELETGKVSWTVDLELPITAGPGLGDGILVVGTADGAVIALERAGGAQRWRAEVSSEVLAPPAIDTGMTVVRAQDGRVFGFRSEDGSRAWVYDQSVPLLTLRGSSPPLIRGGFVYLGFDNGKVASLRLSDGAVRWEETVAVPQGRTELERIVDIDGPMAVVASDLYAVSFQGLLAAITADAGRLLWVKDMSSFTGLAVARTQLFVSDADDSVWALDRLSGGTLWRQDRLARRSLSAPAAHGEYVVVGDFEGYLHWLEEDTGEFVARARAGGSAVTAQPLALGPILVVQTQGGRVVAYRLGSS
ncbi:MAG: outer membrane protein assembly factor BamB [Xanthomonadales bacterium]|nr:outer membrane protein assembly factor BamB [Xanthomonadales bacterium]